MTEIATIETDVKKAISFGISHLILIAMLAGSICVGVYLYDSKRADRAEAQSNAAIQIAKAQDSTNVQVQQQATQQISQLQQEIAAQQQQYNSLAQLIISRNTQLAAQQKQDANLPPTQLAARWQDVAKLPDDITTLPTGDFNVSQQDALLTLQQLETIPVINANLATNNQQLALVRSELDNEDIAFGVEGQAHQSDVLACTADKKALNDQIVTLKAQARRSKMRWFGIGYVAGFISGKIF